MDYKWRIGLAVCVAVLAGWRILKKRPDDGSESRKKLDGESSADMDLYDFLLV
jgi:hypothetical protein